MKELKIRTIHLYSHKPMIASVGFSARYLRLAVSNYFRLQLLNSKLNALYTPRIVTFLFLVYSTAILLQHIVSRCIDCTTHCIALYRLYYNTLYRAVSIVLQHIVSRCIDCTTTHSIALYRLYYNTLYRVVWTVLQLIVSRCIDCTTTHCIALYRLYYNTLYRVK
jgi:hypothetical protein